MKTTFPKRSKPFEEKIRQIGDVIVNCGKDKIAFVILFGSFARGNWVFDRYSEDHITYQYASDYDFLIITNTAKQSSGSSLFELNRKIHNELEGLGLIDKYGHNPHFVIEPINRVNDDLRKSKYFFSDIKKEGIILYDSGKFELSKMEDLSEERRKEIAKDDYDYWMENAEVRLEDFYSNLEKSSKSQKYLNKAAFELHQAVENLYSCVLLVFTGYKPKTHNLEELNRRCAIHSRKFLTIFPMKTKEQQDNFNLLQKAYIDARYNKNFKIAKEQLQYLVKRSNDLKDSVQNICKEKITI